MAYIHECDICGKRFPNGTVLNVVSFFRATEASPAGLNTADPRYELCDYCFKILRDTAEVLRVSLYEESNDFERGEK